MSRILIDADNSLSMKPNLENFWRLESIGIQESPTESDDTKALNRFNETLSFKNGPRPGRDPSTGRGPRLDGDLSLGGGPRPGRDQSPGRGPRLDGDLSQGGGPRPGRDQSPGRGSRLDGDPSLGGGPRPGRDLRIGRGLRTDIQLGRGRSFEQDLSIRVLSLEEVQVSGNVQENQVWEKD